MSLVALAGLLSIANIGFSLQHPAAYISDAYVHRFTTELHSHKNTDLLVPPNAPKCPATCAIASTAIDHLHTITKVLRVYYINIHS